MTKTDINKAMLQQISDVAWLVHQGSNKLGILNKDVQETYFYVTGKELVKFKGEQEVLEHFGNVTLFKEQLGEKLQKPSTYYIKGYEVDYEEPFAVDENDPDYNPDVPLYTKIDGSKIYYAAGYYCINFDKGWKHARGPKYSTLTKYGFTGPYRSELEARQQMKKLNNQ